MADDTAERCDWPVSYALCGTCTELDQASPEDRLMFEDMAGDYLWRWTQRVFGLCALTVRPCRAECGRGTTFWGGGPYPTGAALRGGGPYPAGLYPAGAALALAWACGRCGGQDSCGCDRASSIRLPGPVHAVDRVVIDGETLPASAYALYDRRDLIRVDGGEWPVCQNMSLPLTDLGTWAVEYRRGSPVPAGGRTAAGVLACELARAACGSASCALPKRLQSVTRQGVTIAVLDSFDDIDTGHTGIWIIDSWVASILHAPRGGQVRSPDVGQKFRSAPL